MLREASGLGRLLSAVANHGVLNFVQVMHLVVYGSTTSSILHDGPHAHRKDGGIRGIAKVEFHDIAPDLYA
jgi:hypothetical protein